MCGINGLLAFAGRAAPERRQLIATRDHMAARGPDGVGEWWSEDGRAGLGHRRLSIIDLSDRASQPMQSADGRYVVTFNGEIYNFRALRARLEAAGRQFRTESDTETLLHLFAEKGEAMTDDLRGMYAFAIWDIHSRRLFLARDPYGVKPLYYSDAGGVFSFASSVRALVSAGHLSREPAAAGLVGFFILGSVPEPWTIYRDLRCLPAGATLWVDERGAGEPVVRHSVAAALAAAEREQQIVDPQEAADRMRAALLDSVSHHLVADVPVGAFLSAGVDSGALVGLMRDAGQNDIRTITLAYQEYVGTPADEAPLAGLVARHYGATQSVRAVTAAEFAADLPKIIAAMDQPSIDGVNTWFVAKAAREFGLKAAFSGVGGDELFGGYHTFRRVPKLAGAMAWPARVWGMAGANQAAVDFARALGAPMHPKLAGMTRYGATLAGAYLLQRCVFLPSELDSLDFDPKFISQGVEQLDAERLVARAALGGPTSGFGTVAALESSLYLRNQLLRDADWASMAHSLEVRTPLVDYTLLRAAAPIVLGNRGLSGKALLAGAPSQPLPDAVLNRRKTGFAIPVQRWASTAGRLAAGRRDEPFSRTWARQVADWYMAA